jgi:CPA2 family monovalent cation:H+ antiporter-2
MDFTASIRSSDYEMLTSVKGRPHKPSLQHLHIPNREIVTLSVQQNNRDIVGKSIQTSGIGKNFRVTVLAIKRDTQYITEILPDTKIKQGDLLYIFGNPLNINRLNEALSY